MRHYWKLLFTYLMILFVFPGCAKAARGISEDNVYYSTQSPNVQIKIKFDSKYERGTVPGQYQHRFLDSEGQRVLYIHYWPNDLNERKLDYNEHPDQWIYEPCHDCVEIERLEREMAGEKWYVRDAVEHVSPSSCYIFRDLGVYTEMHDILKLIYFWEMPANVCKDWRSTSSLSNSQRQYLKEFRTGFAGNVEITEYRPKLEEKGRKRIVQNSGAGTDKRLTASLSKPAPLKENRSVVTQSTVQVDPKNHVAVFPSAFNFDADSFQGVLEQGIPTAMEDLLADIARFKQFQFTNLLKEKRLRDISWNRHKPNLSGVINQAEIRGIDFVILYYFSFGEGQGLANGWGTDFRNPTFKTFLIDINNQTVSEKKDIYTISLDQLTIELKGMSRQLLRKTEFPN